jgi:YesN/AraC family two-component response regulator
VTGKPRLLIVDDEREILDFLMLVFRDCEAETALNTESALEALRKKRFDVLITDIKMPGSLGLTLIDSAKENWPETAIVVITGHYQEMPAEIEGKVHQWILKPFTIETIREAVMSSLERR